MIKKILITGASGYLGRNLLKYFKKKNYHISIISKKKIYGTTYLGNDLRNNNVDKSYKFDLIINCAAKGVYTKETKKDIYKVNYYDLLYFFKKLYSYGNFKWIFIGSAFEYGFIKDKALSAKYSELKPIDDYGKSKVKFYKKIKKIKLKKKFQILYLRLFHLYGGDEPQKRLYPSLIKSINQNKNFEMSEAKELRDFIKINSAIIKINKSLNYFSKKNNFFLTKHIATGKKTSVKNFAIKLWKKHKSKNKIFFNSIPKKGGYDSVYSDKVSLI
ncbi:NAD-dependent epimerase/dehydratase family protein [bacterium]|nr:NAD-dependent epimerase/dehydratase family protein [bacterium]